MNDPSVKLLTVFTETALESRLISDFERMGAAGYTITNARGKGSQGARNADWEANSNIRIEVICSVSTAQKITDFLEQEYYANYAMVSFTSDIDVIRPEKFTTE